MRNFFFTHGTVLALIMTLCSCTRTTPSRSEFVLGTYCTVSLYEKGTDKLYSEIFSRLASLESVLSANRDDTNIAMINSSSGIAPVIAMPETRIVLREALAFAEETRGLFDPAIGPLVKAWNIGTEEAAVPGPQELKNALTLVDYRKIHMNDEQGTVFLEDRGMRLDLGAIAKGYAADEVVKILETNRIGRAIIDLGGNVYAFGRKKPGKDWEIGVRDPETTGGNPILSLSVSNRSVVTSGINERFFEKDGKHYHHILDPRTGYPAETGLLSVTIISSTSMLADALSTSTFLLGLEAGMELISKTEGVEAIFITTDHTVWTSPGLKGKVRLLDTGYKLKE
jgi:Membrane-associated lipoprotein involved in thiamine biosynthesis